MVDDGIRPEDHLRLAASGDRVDAVALLEKLYPHARRILARRFGIVGEPATRAQVARELGITEGQLQRRERAALAVLRKIAQRGRPPARIPRDRATLPQ